jgi:hypothetical protein
VSWLMNWEWATHVDGRTVIPGMTAALFAGLLATAAVIRWMYPPPRGGRAGRALTSLTPASCLPSRKAPAALGHPADNRGAILGGLSFPRRRRA